MTNSLKFGTNVYKFTNFGACTGKLVEFVQKAEALGYYHVRVLDHVVGVHAERHGGIAETPYTAKSNINECFTLIAYLSALTSTIRFETGVLGLPQRQTVLVAKQVAEIDILSGGRIILGVGVGYNAVEFEAMGASFPDRGKRFEEQIHVLRTLWSSNDVTFKGQWHTLNDIALAPLPIQRPIPLWFGLGRTNAPIPPDGVLRRVGRLADGWLPLFNPGEEARVAIAKVHEAAVAAGRDPADIGMEVNLRVENKSPDELMDTIHRFVELGASRFNVGFPEESPDGQIEALYRFREIMDRFGS